MNRTACSTVTLLVLLLATKGHMSSGIEKITLADLARRSDAILVVRKANPPIKKVKFAFPKPLKGHFSATAHRFHVLSIVEDPDSLVKGTTIQVYSATDEDNYRQTVRELQGEPAAMTIHPYYDSALDDPAKEERFVIFVTHNPETRRFSFAANGAYEKEGVIGEIRSSNHPTPPKTAP